MKRYLVPVLLFGLVCCRSVWASDIPDKSVWHISASSESADLVSGLVADGDYSTRWSSQHSEPQWLQIDLGSAVNLSGLSVFWERAYASDYSVDVSEDGVAWETVARVRFGMGGRDEIWFYSLRARYVRLFCHSREHQWGFSIFEIEIYGDERGVSQKNNEENRMQMLNICDGNKETYWQSSELGVCQLDIDMGYTREFGGVWIEWGKNAGRDVVISVSDDKDVWTPLVVEEQGSQRFVTYSHDPVKGRYLRVDMSGGINSEEQVQVRDVMLLGPDEKIDAKLNYRLAADRVARGMYPLQLFNEQVYWTLSGLPRDSQESLLDEYGNLEPAAKLPCLMPYIRVDDRVYSGLDAGLLEQELAEDYLPLPSVSWRNLPIELDVSVVTDGEPGRAVTFAAYTLRNATAEKQHGRLFLAVRPFQINPEWQYGGMAPISNLQMRTGTFGADVVVNEALEFVALDSPSGYGVRAFNQGDVVEAVLNGVMPKEVALTDEDGLLSGMLWYDFELQPGDEKTVVIAAPLNGRLDCIDKFVIERDASDLSNFGEFKAVRKRRESMWRELIGRVKVELPRKDVSDMLKAQVGYIMINADGIAIQPGSRNYKRAWMRDGSMTGAALLRMGLTNEVRDYLDFYSGMIQDNGWVPPIVHSDGTIDHGFGWDKEYDSQGEYLYAMMEYYRFTKDLNFLEKHFDKMHGSMKFLVQLRERTLSPDHMKDSTSAKERFRGILPPSISHEGYGTPMHSYWDDFWALKGWRDGAEAARLLGHDDVAAWADEQYGALRESVRTSISAVLEDEGSDTIPGCADSRYSDPTSTAIAFFPCGEADLMDPVVVERTFAEYYNGLTDRFGSWTGGFTPYEIRSTLAFVEMGQQYKAEDLVNYMLTCRRPFGWQHLAEVVHSDARKGAYIGDMPHTWVGSGYLNSIRGMLVMEKEDTLELLKGTPAEWLEQDGVVLENLPTYFGLLDLRAVFSGTNMMVDLSLEEAAAANKASQVKVYWPLRVRPESVTVDGEAWEDFDHLCVTVPPGTTSIVVAWGDMENRITDLISQMTLAEKTDLVHGADYMQTRSVDRLDIPALKMCDGPHGIRDGSESSCFPTGISMGATWNPELIRRLGIALAEETLAKGHNLLLGPCINLDRVPLGGRNFESFCEDPYLSGELAVGYVKGVQSQGVGTSTKHFTANNQEIDRGTISADMDERTLREIYLPAFERAVKEADTYTIMGAYNRVNGTFCCANHHLLNEILKDEWGFRGFVVSDWFAVHGTEDYANGGLDLEMPGEGEFFGHGKLKTAVESGKVNEQVVNDMVRRILRVIMLMKLDQPEYAEKKGVLNSEGHREIARQVAAESITLLKNEHSTLPLRCSEVKSIAVLGPNAENARTGGGGSSSVKPIYMVSPLDGIRELCGDAVKVEYEAGCAMPCDFDPIPETLLYPPKGMEGQGLHAEYYDNQTLEGKPILTRRDVCVDFSWGFGSPDPLIPVDHFSARWTGRLIPEVSGRYELGLRSDDGSRLYVDGESVLDIWWDHGPECRTVAMDLVAGQEYDLRLEYYEAAGEAEVSLGWSTPGERLRDAQHVARRSDAAIVVVGLSFLDEGEGRDRDSMKLPREQTELIKTVVAANPNTIVVYIGGTPVEMVEWIDQVPAVLSAWYPGQEGGNALAQILFGEVNPSGKLPTTFPVRREDNPSFTNYPGSGPDGNVVFTEGLYMGYRYYDSKNVHPQYAFGHGLSYTTFEYADLAIDADQMQVCLSVENTGDCAGAEVVQLYVRDLKSSVDRPLQELKGFQKIFLEPGEKKVVKFELDERSLAFWHPQKKAWVVEPGEFEMRVGSSSRDIRQTGILRRETPEG